MKRTEQREYYNSQNFTLRFSKKNPTLMENLKRIAEFEDRSVTYVIERILAEYVKKYKDEQ